MNREKLRTYNKEWYAANPDNVKATRDKAKEKRTAYMKKWRKANPDRVRELKRESAKRCLEAARVRRGRWLEKNQDRMREFRRKWVQSNPEKRAADARSRQLRKTQAQPPWLSKEHRESMEGFYRRAAQLTQETGVRHEVDHIIPIRGKIVCGLHVPWNLQVITGTANRAKSARCQN